MDTLYKVDAGELYIMQIGRPYTGFIQKTINVSDVEDLGRVYVGDLGLVGCGRPLTCRMQKTLNRLMWGNVLGF